MENKEEFQKNNLTRIENKLKWLESSPQGLIYKKSGKNFNIIINKAGNQIRLFFSEKRNQKIDSISGIMSRIDLNRPFDLLGIYTQAMMLSLLWKSSPQKVYVIGFGGGRLSMVFHHYFPDVIIDNTEIDRNVVQLSKKFFGIDEDNRMKIYEEDGRDFLQKRQQSIYDIILIDCFSGAGDHPYRLSTKDFYEICKNHLASNGVVATNLSKADPLFGNKIKTFIDSFKYSWQFEHEGEHVFFGSEFNIMPNEFFNNAKQIILECPFEFPFIERSKELETMNTNSFYKLLYNNTVLSDSPLESGIISANDPMFDNIGRNEFCPCGSGRKYKKCHGNK